MLAASALLSRHATLFFLSWTDEQIHFYVARRVAEGAVLFRDIDSARPPLVLWPLAWLMRLGASPLFAGRALVLAAQLGTAALLLWSGRAFVSSRVGLLAALLFLSAPETFSRIHYTGIHLVALSASACVVLALRGRPWAAGLACGLSLGFGQHGIVLCLAAAVLTMGRRPREALHFVAGALLVGLLVFGGAWLAGARHLWRFLVAVHLYHARTQELGSGGFWELFKPWLYEHGYVLLGAVIATALLLARKWNPSGADAPADDDQIRNRRTLRLLPVVLAAHVAVVLAMADALFLYFVVVAPLLTFLAALGFDEAWRTRRLRVPALLAMLGLIVGGWAAARADRERLDQRTYSFLPHLLHGEISRFHRMDHLVQEVSAALPAAGPLFGDPTITSAVALASGRRIASELADWNPIWVGGGTLKREEIATRIEREGVAAIVTPPWFLVQDRHFRAYLEACYDRPQVASSPEGMPGEGLPEVLVFRHATPATSCKLPSLQD